MDVTRRYLLVGTLFAPLFGPVIRHHQRQRIMAECVRRFYDRLTSSVWGFDVGKGRDDWFVAVIPNRKETE